MWWVGVGGWGWVVYSENNAILSEVRMGFSDRSSVAILSCLQSWESRRKKRDSGLDPFLCPLSELLLLILLYEFPWQLVVEPTTSVEETSS